MMKIAAGDQLLRVAIAGSGGLGALAFWLSHYLSLYHIVTALAVTVLVTCVTSLAAFPLAARSYALTAERLVVWLIMLAAVAFLVSRWQITLFVLAFRDSPPSLIDRLSSLGFILSAISLVVVLLVLPFRRSDAVIQRRATWVLVAMLDTFAVIQTVVLG